MKINMTRAAGCAALLAGAAALLLILPDAAFAQAGADITAGVVRGYQWLVNVVRVIAGIVFLVGGLLFSVGRFHYTGGLIMVAGLLAAVRGDAIAQYLMGA